MLTFSQRRCHIFVSKIFHKLELSKKNTDNNYHIKLIAFTVSDQFWWLPNFKSQGGVGWKLKTKKVQVVFHLNELMVL